MSKYAGTISGPIAPYSNVPIQAGFYAPNQFFISAISLGQTTVITTSVDHNFVISQEIRLIIPPSFGCRQLNEQSGFVLSIPASNQVRVSIYSLGGDSYIASTATTKAQILPIGDISNGQINSNGRVNSSLNIPGSFINISPL